MAVYAIGCEAFHFRPAVTNRAWEIDDNTFWQPARGYASFHSGNIGYLDSKDAAGATMPLASGWFHTYMNCGPINTRNIYTLSFCDSSANELFGLRMPASGNNVELAIGPAGTPTASVSTSLTGSTDVLGGRVTLDFYFECALAGKVQLYINGTLAYTLTGDTRPLAGAGVTQLKFRGTYGVLTQVYNYNFSQCILSDKPTVGARVHTVPLTAVSGATPWTGSFSGINGMVEDDGTFMQAVNSGDVLKASNAGLPLALQANFEVTALVFSARAKYESGSAFTKLEVAENDGTTDHFYAAKTLTTTFADYHERIDLDPGTGAKWTSARLAASKFGFRSAT